MDKREVYMLTPVHSNEIISTGKIDRKTNQYMQKYSSQRTTLVGRPSVDNPLRLTARHFPTYTQSKRRCIVCGSTTKREKKRTISNYECSECNVWLYVNGCFRDYYTLKHFKLISLFIFYNFMLK